MNKILGSDRKKRKLLFHRRPPFTPQVMRIFFVSIGILLVVGILLIRGCAFFEEPAKYYSSRQDIVSDNAIERGWVPPWLPASAHAINEVHNIDTNEVWMKFKLDPAELNAIESCRKDAATSFDNAHGPYSKLCSWWAKPKDKDLDGYICRWKFYDHSREAKMIVSRSNGIALYWEEH